LKKLGSLALMLLLMISLTLAGCANQKSAHDVLQEAYEKSAGITSAKFEGTMKIGLDLPDSVLEGDPDALMVLNMLNNAELTFRGTSQIDPLKAELFITARIKGDMSMDITLPLLVTESKLWVKVPNIPLLPIPDELKNKYIELDFEQLSEMAGEEIGLAFDEKLQQRYKEVGSELMELFFGAFDKKQFFVKMKAKDAGLPEDLDVKQVVKFELTNENLRPFIKTLIEILPDLVEKLSELDEFAIAQEDIDTMIEELEANADEIDSVLDEIEKNVDINEAAYIVGINKDGYVTYTGVHFDADLESDGERGSLRFNVEMKQTNINKEQDFEIKEPKSSDVISLNELITLFLFSEF